MKTKQKKPSQSKAILAYLKTGKALTSLDALVKFSCFRLAARVHELKRKGHKIKQEAIHNNGKSYARYTISKRK